MDLPHLNDRLTEATNLSASFCTNVIARLLGQSEETTILVDAYAEDLDSDWLSSVEPADVQTEIAVMLTDAEKPIFFRIRMLEMFVVREALKRHFGLEKLKMVHVFQATRQELQAVMANPNVQHVIVSGHGSWSSWTDADRRNVSNADFCLPDDAPKKRSFTRLTCGRPVKEDTSESELGSHVAEQVFGRATVALHTDFIEDPLSRNAPGLESMQDKNPVIEFLVAPLRSGGSALRLVRKGLRKLLK